MVRFTLSAIPAVIGMMAISASPGFSQTPRPTLLTVFECSQYGRNGYASVATRGGQKSDPMILWTRSFGGFLPLQRCNIVNERLNRAIATTDKGSLSNLYLTFGQVRGSMVICYVNSMEDSCNKDNILFTLRPQDRGREREILEQVAYFGTAVSGSPIQQSGSRYFAPLGQAIEKAFAPKPSSRTP
ncbi:hypothetical protein H6F89_28300 [Cyanobacteria bacterium FACHB-63]|nr:hypothetical protein [Cyanobacteria bacterium FACHB-63]